MEHNNVSEATVLMPMVGMALVVGAQSEHPAMQRFGWNFALWCLVLAGAHCSLALEYPMSYLTGSEHQQRALRSSVLSKLFCAFSAIQVCIDP